VSEDVTAGPELHLRLRDGTRTRLRPVVPADKARLADGFASLSPRSRYLRFHGAIGFLTDRQLAYFTEIDYRDHMAWVAIDEDRPEQPGMGVARYVRLADDPEVAEAAITVADAYQGRGLGTVLLTVLGGSARRNGIHTFRSYVLAANTAMITLFRSLGATVRDDGDSVFRVDLALPDDPDELPDTPAGRVVRELAAAGPSLLFGTPLWLHDVSDVDVPSEHEVPPRTGPERGPLRDWLDAMFDDETSPPG
jgi:RimJ/RimL family protein N-acetyltransferase